MTWDDHQQAFHQIATIYFRNPRDVEGYLKMGSIYLDVLIIDTLIVDKNDTLRNFFNTL